MSDSVRSRGQVEGGGGAGVGDEEGRHVSSFSRMSRFHSVFPAQWYAALRCAAQCCAALRCAALRGACWTQRSHPLLRLSLIDKRTVPAGRRMNADVRARPAQARMFITTHLRLLVHRHAYCSDPLRSAPVPVRTRLRRSARHAPASNCSRLMKVGSAIRLVFCRQASRRRYARKTAM